MEIGLHSYFSGNTSTVVWCRNVADNFAATISFLAEDNLSIMK